MAVSISLTSPTIIHFEGQTVTSVSVGDPQDVAVTVRGSDVILRGLEPVSNIRGVIWIGAQYTQWDFAVRVQAAPRLILVRAEPPTAAAQTAEIAGTGARAATGEQAAWCR